jgi:DNA-binding PadR family transcriptional regulator
MAENLLRDFYLGFIRIHILYHARRAPIFGVELMKELARHGYTVGPGTLYPILHSLEQKGLLVSMREVVDGKARRYYRLTAQGEKILRGAQKQAAELISEINEE